MALAGRLQLNIARAVSMNIFVEQNAHVLLAQVPPFTAGPNPVPLQGSLDRHTNQGINVGDIYMIPTSALPAGAVHKNASLLVCDQFTFWFLRSRTANHMVISFVDHIGADALVNALQLHIGVEISVDRDPMFKVINLLLANLAESIVVWGVYNDYTPHRRTTTTSTGVASPNLLP